MLDSLLNLLGVLIGGFITYVVTRHFELRKELKEEREQAITLYIYLNSAQNRLIQLRRAINTREAISAAKGATAPKWTLISDVLGFEEQQFIQAPAALDLFTRAGDYETITKLFEAVEAYNTILMTFRKISQLNSQLQSEAIHEPGADGLFTTSWILAKSGPDMAKINSAADQFMTLLDDAIQHFHRSLTYMAVRANEIRPEMKFPKFELVSLRGDPAQLEQ